MTRNLDVPPKKLNLDVFLHPEKYSAPLPMVKIVADTKVDPDGVKRYKDMLAVGEQLRPIVVVKHPRKDLYSVVDGHHRFFAHLELGMENIECAVIYDFTGFMFNLTKDGWLQPPPAVTKHVHAPILEFKEKLDKSINQELRQNMKQFLDDFNKNPENLVEIFKERYDQADKKLSELKMNWEKAIRDLQTTWAQDFQRLKSDLESVIYNLTHQKVNLKIEGKDEPIRKTELNLITGDITVTFPAGIDIKGIDIEKINIAAIKMAREELKDRISKLLELIEILINALSPGGTLNSILDIIKASITKKK